MNRFYELPLSDKKAILQQIGEQTGLPAYAVEKDWWVVQALTLLFELEVGPYMIFKGGTSLSKAWGVIERFSEDIDLAIARSFFGYEGNLSRSQRTKLRKKANAYVLSVICPELLRRFHEKGLAEVVIEPGAIESSDQDPVIVHLIYPYVIESPGYLQPKVQIEISCRSLDEPYTNRPVISLVDEGLPGQLFSQEAIDIPSANPERTFLEKVFLLHEEFQRPVEKRRVDRLSRHLYDLYRLSGTAFIDEALKDPVLYQAIVNHRKRFTRLSGVDYGLHQPQTVDPLPPRELMKSWEADYRTMQEQMIYGQSPGFEDLISGVSRVKQKINETPWSVQID